MFPAQAGNAAERQEILLVLRQAQDEEDWENADLSIFLMLSLSKHVDVVT